MEQGPGSREQRRRERERTLVFGKASTFEEHTQQGEQYWQSVPLAQKFQAIVELIRDSWYLQGADGPPPRLDRSAHGTRKLGRYGAPRALLDEVRSMTDDEFV